MKHGCARLACRGKTSPLAPGDENCRCQNHFGMDDNGGFAFLPREAPVKVLLFRAIF
jgi:hypothetical protein